MERRPPRTLGGPMPWSLWRQLRSRPIPSPTRPRSWSTPTSAASRRRQERRPARGLPLPPKATELLACDSRVQTVLHDDDGGMFHISSPSYVVPARIRRQVEHRDDYRCTFPGCGTRAFTDVHHIVPWPKGPSQPSNLIVVCRTHHRVVHVFGWHVRLKPKGITEWFKPDWTPYEPRPAPKPAVL